MGKTTRDSFGRLDIILANAGVGGERVEFVDLPIDEWDRVIGVNLRSLAHTCKATAPALIDAGGGLMALMGSSTGGWDTILGSGPQMTSQEAIKAVARDLALELARYRIRDNAVCPSSSKQH